MQPGQVRCRGHRPRLCSQSRVLPDPVIELSGCVLGVSKLAGGVVGVFDIDIATLAVFEFAGVALAVLMVSVLCKWVARASIDVLRYADHGSCAGVLKKERIWARACQKQRLEEHQMYLTGPPLHRPPLILFLLARVLKQHGLS